MLWFYSLRSTLCESIRYQAKSEQNFRQDLIPRVRHGEAALMHPKYLHLPFIPLQNFTKNITKASSSLVYFYNRQLSIRLTSTYRLLLICSLALLPERWSQNSYKFKRPLWGMTGNFGIRYNNSLSIGDHNDRWMLSQHKNCAKNVGVRFYCWIFYMNI